MGDYLFTLLLSMLLFLAAGCSAMYVTPGENPATLRVYAVASLDPEAADNFMQYQALSTEQYLAVKWGGAMEPRWAIKAYMLDNSGQLHPLLSNKSNPYEGSNSYKFSGQRDFIIPAGNYPVEIWLEAYMHYCIGANWNNCGTPTFKIWRQALPIDQFAPGGYYEAAIGDADINPGNQPDN